MPFVASLLGVIPGVIMEFKVKESFNNDAYLADLKRGKVSGK